MSKVLRYEGHNYFRQRLVLATLSGKVLKIEKIRHNDANPGLRGTTIQTCGMVFRYPLPFQESS